MQQPGILQPAEADSTSIGRRRFTELLSDAAVSTAVRRLAAVLKKTRRHCRRPIGPAGTTLD
jgi:MarR-like DNA-binding transcriptional regulator SgrR of sgrS sRNA